MAESNPIRWIVLGAFAAAAFAVGLVMLVQTRVETAKAQAAAVAQASAAEVARADGLVTAELDRARAVAGSFIGEVGKGLYRQAYTRMAAPYRTAVPVDGFVRSCQASPILAGARQVVLRRLRMQTGGGAATLEADGLVDSSAGAVPASFVFLDGATGPLILTVSLAGVPVLQGVAPAR